MNVDPTFAGFDAQWPWYAPHGGSTLAHELGHNHGRKHVDCGGPDKTDPDYPYNECDIGVAFPGTWYGFDYLDNAVIHPTEAGDLMSYSMSVGKPRWPSAYTYEAIYDKVGAAAGLSPLPVSVASDPAGSLTCAVLEADEVLALTGFITLTESTARLGHGYRLPEGLVGPEKLAKLSESVLTGPGAAYSLRLLDAGDGILDRQDFDPPSTEDGPGDESSFFMVTPYMTGTASVALFAGDTELTRRPVSPASPQVTVLEPNGGESYAVSLTAEWAAVDADGDSLLYTVQYSPDNGDTWRVVVTDHTTTTLEIDDAAYLPGSSEALIRVIATDGINTGLDVSDGPFSLRPHPPTVKISKPDEGDLLGLGDQVTLVGSGWDAEDGALEGEALAWHVDGQLAGSGEDAVASGLALGSHTITLRGTDSDGMMAEDQVTIRVRRQACSSNENRLAVVFLLDTSPAVTPYGEAVCGAVSDAADDLADMGLEVRHRVLAVEFSGPVAGLGTTQSCVTQTVRQIDPGTAVDHASDWGAAIRSVADHYDWREGYTRLIVPVSNQGPEDGNPVDDPGADRDAIEAAVDAARGAGVSVVPLVMPPADSVSYPAVLRLANDVAQATGGDVVEWPVTQAAGGGAAVQQDPSTSPLADALEGTQSRVGCVPAVLGVAPGGRVTDTTPLAVAGLHLWPGVQVSIGGRPAGEVMPSPEGTLVTFWLPTGLEPGRAYDLQVRRPGVGEVVLADAIVLQPSIVYLPIVARRSGGEGVVGAR
jgi:hypothetical protein